MRAGSWASLRLPNYPLWTICGLLRAARAAFSKRCTSGQRRRTLRETGNPMSLRAQAKFAPSGSPSSLMLLSSASAVRASTTLLFVLRSALIGFLGLVWRFSRFMACSSVGSETIGSAERPTLFVWPYSASLNPAANQLSLLCSISCSTISSVPPCTSKAAIASAKRCPARKLPWRATPLPESGPTEPGVLPVA